MGRTRQTSRPGLKLYPARDRELTGCQRDGLRLRAAVTWSVVCVGTGVCLRNSAAAAWGPVGGMGSSWLLIAAHG